ncbi:MAG TPA: aminoglycoside 6-adenylyltransferase [Ktedonobacterales bacterium]|jgi:aminoglycoside 6-adenylyltransferase|nr:aminoglycoside 6-adenylyltransferase [Ktedonobacterales bacterium]
MSETIGEAEVLGRLVRWAEQHPLVRALVLESSRAHGQASLDIFSDYDVLVVVSDADLQAFADDDTWLSGYGASLVMLHVTNPVEDVETSGRLVLYQDHIKIDYMVWPAMLLRAAVERQELPDLLDWGYRALVDKDGLTAGLPAPTRTAHIPGRPTEQEYLAVVEEFWWESTYVAKNLWRDDLMQAKYNLDVVMRHEVLLQMLEWRIELDHNWSWKPGPAGKGLKQYLPPALWAELETTWVSASIEENWTALFAMTALFRRAASEVASALGYTYPIALDQGVTAYLEKVHTLPH